jgi:hypothetical protein
MLRPRARPLPLGKPVIAHLVEEARVKSAFRLLVAGVVMMLLLPGAASATHVPDQSLKMDELFTSPNQATNSDLAFWGKYAFVGYYTGDTGSPVGTAPRGGVRIYDISKPSSPRLVRNLRCDGLQADPIVWDTDDNGVPDLLMLAVDRTMVRPECGAPRSFKPDGTAFHEDPTGWEGVRIFTMSDNPDRPFRAIEQVKAVYTDCGAHTITAWPGELEETGNLLVYVSSYPLRPGPTCGVASPAAGDGFENEDNPYDEDPGSPDTPLHGVIQVVEVPVDTPEDSQELDVQPAISYPGDPDGVNEWCERGGTLCPPAFEPAAIACHDIVVHVEHRMAGAACADQGQVWEIDEDGIPMTEDPMLVGDDEVTGGANAQIPGAVDFFHSVMFNNAGTVVNWVDESFGTGCPTMTTYQSRAWNPAGGTHKTGRMFFTDIEGNFLSEFHVGDLRPDPGATEYCSAHMGMAVMGIEEDILVNAWYTGGADVIDFTDPTNLEEIAFYDPQQDSGTWSAYPYTGPLFKKGPGIPVYASDGVENNAIAEGMVVYRARNIEEPRRSGLVDHLNPQTMDHEMMGGGGGRGDDDDDDDDRGKGRGKGRGDDDDDDDDRHRGKGRGRR